MRELKLAGVIIGSLIVAALIFEHFGLHLG